MGTNLMGRIKRFEQNTTIEGKIDRVIEPGHSRLFLIRNLLALGLMEMTNDLDLSEAVYHTQARAAGYRPSNSSSVPTPSNIIFGTERM